MLGGIHALDAFKFDQQAVLMDKDDDRLNADI